MHKCGVCEKYMCNLNLNCTSHRNLCFCKFAWVFSPYSLTSDDTISFFNYNQGLILEFQFRESWFYVYDQDTSA